MSFTLSSYNLPFCVCVCFCRDMGSGWGGGERGGGETETVKYIKSVRLEDCTEAQNNRLSSHQSFKTAGDTQPNKAQSSGEWITPSARHVFGQNGVKTGD